jgi:predicted RNA binding protein YcfA (HicA-like mRNA interferase family)
MKIPRDISGRELGKELGKLGYNLTRQKGSHMRFTTQQKGEHHIAPRPFADRDVARDSEGSGGASRSGPSLRSSSSWSYDGRCK